MDHHLTILAEDNRTTKCNCIGVLGFVGFCLSYLLVQIMAFVTMWFANLANVNPGIITVIWALGPLYTALADWCLFHQKLQSYHYVGMVFIITCAIVIAISPMISPPEVPVVVGEFGELKPVTALGSWVPVLMAVFTPVAFAVNGMMVKHLTGMRNPKQIEEQGEQTDEQKKLNWNANGLSFTCYVVANLAVLCYGIPFWVYVDFSQYHFIVGTISAIINTLGLAATAKAISTGPGGPVTAVTSVSTILLVIIEAIKKSQVPTALQFVGLIFGIIGSMSLVIPD